MINSYKVRVERVEAILNNKKIANEVAGVYESIIEADEDEGLAEIIEMNSSEFIKVVDRDIFVATMLNIDKPKYNRINEFLAGAKNLASYRDSSLRFKNLCGTYGIKNSGNTYSIEEIVNATSAIKNVLSSYESEEEIELDPDELSDEEDYFESEEINGINIDDILNGIGVEEDEEEIEIELDAEAEEILNSDSLEEEEPETADNEVLDEEAKAAGGLDDAERQKEIDKEEEKRLEVIVNGSVNEIMQTYNVLYAPLFRQPHRGIFYTNNNTGKSDIISIGKDGDGVKVHNVPSLSIHSNFIYTCIKDTLGELREAPPFGKNNMSISAEWMNPDGTLVYNYMPHIQIRNSAGVYTGADGKLVKASNWSEFQKVLSKSIKPTILAMLKRVNTSDDTIIKRAIESIQELFTTVFIVNEFDSEKAVRFTMCCKNKSMSVKMGAIAPNIVEANPFSRSKDAYSIQSNEAKNDIWNTLIVTDKDRYKGEINFAYKTLGSIVKAGGKLGLDHTVIGKDLKGEPVEINLKENTLMELSIIAGARSGKGVLTLALLASVIASNSPMIYLDSKPDMAAIFWKMEQEFRSQGREDVRILAVDAAMNTKLESGINGEVRIDPIRKYNAGADCPVSEINGSLSNIAYIKGIQLMSILGNARNSGLISKKKRCFFVLDELQVFTDNLVETKADIKQAMDKYKKEKEGEGKEKYDYLIKLDKLYNGIGADLSDFKKCGGPMGYMMAITLGQVIDLNTWKEPAISQFIKQSNLRILGSGTNTGSSQYTLNYKGGVQGIDLLGQGYFGITRAGSNSSGSNTKMVKTSLVLNEADYDPKTGQAGSYTGTMLNNVSDEIKEDLINNDYVVSENNEIAIDAGYKVGEANPLVGFPALIKYLASSIKGFDLGKSLSSGYDEVEELLTKLGILGENGKYENVEHYLYSASEDSIFASSDLKEAVKRKITIYEQLNSNEAPEFKVEKGNGEELGEENSSGEIAFNSQETGEAGEFSEVEKDKSDIVGFGANGMEDSFEKSIRNKEIISSDLKLMRVSELIKRDLDDDTLNIYLMRKVLNAAQDNRFNYHQRTKEKNAIFNATMVMSNMHYLCEVRRLYDLGKLKRYYVVQIQNGQNVENHTIALGMLRDYSNGTLKYDIVPSSSRIRQYLEVINQAKEMRMSEIEDNISEEYRDMVDDSTSVENRYTAKVIMESDDTCSWSIGKDGEAIIEDVRDSQRDITLNERDYNIVQGHKNPIIKALSKNILKSRNGQDYEFRERWEYILDTIAQDVENKAFIRRVEITDYCVRTNAKTVYIDGLLDNNYDLIVSDIASIKKLMKKFKSIESLKLCKNLMTTFYNEYGDVEGGMQTIFNENKALNRVVIETDGQPINVTRGSLAREAERLRKEANEAKLRADMETVVASKNRRLDEKSPAYTQKVWRNTKGISSNMLKSANKNLLADNPCFTKALGYSVVAGTAFILGGGVSLISGGFHAFKKLINV